jgi:formiminotetrahydrofolate cyclodeaminase
MSKAEGYAHLCIEDLLQRLADEVPILPAAGTALALLGAMAAALEGFVAALSRGCELSDPQTRDLEKILADLPRLRRQCTALMDRDAEAYREVFAALHMPCATAKEGSRRATALNRALAAALDPPMALVDHALAMLEIGRRLISWGYPAALADTASAVEMAYACVQGSIWIARANLQRLSDDPAAQKYGRRLAGMQSMAEECYRSVRRELEDRLGNPLNKTTTA